MFGALYVGGCFSGPSAIVHSLLGVWEDEQDRLPEMRKSIAALAVPCAAGRMETPNQILQSVHEDDRV